MHLLILTLVINLLIFFQKELTMINLSLDYIEHNKTITISTLITRLFHLFVISNIFYHEGATMVFIQANNENNNIYI